MKLLHVDSSVLGDASVSRQLTAATVAAWRQADPGLVVDYLDLAREAPAHVGPDALALKFGLADASLSAAQRRENAVTEQLLQQFLAADIVVIGAPMYNFGVPTQLKAWIDRLAQPGRTFRYTENGPVGLAGGKKVIVVSSRGGVYSTSAQGTANDHQESFLKTVFGFFGISDLQFVRAEGVGMGAGPRAQALQQARAAIAALVAQPADAEAVAA